MHARPILTPAQIDQLHALIREQEQRLRASMESALNCPACGDRGAARSGCEPEAEGAADVAHLLAGQDNGLDSITFRQRVQAIRDIEAAKAGLKDSTYGLCKSCQAPISFTRLLVLPTAQRCLACQLMYERANCQEPHRA